MPPSATRRTVRQPDVVIAPVTPQRGVHSHQQPTAPARPRPRPLASRHQYQHTPRPLPRPLTPPPTHPEPQRRRVLSVLSSSSDTDESDHDLRILNLNTRRNKHPLSDDEPGTPIAHRGTRHAHRRHKLSDNEDDDDGYRPEPMEPASDNEPERLAIRKRARRAQRLPWSEQEVRALFAGMEKYAASSNKWSAILKDPRFGRQLQQRSVVDLKDKARNCKKQLMREGRVTREELGVLARVSHRGGDGARHYLLEL